MTEEVDVTEPHPETEPAAITPFFATLNVKPDTRPKFFKPRPINFSLREKVEARLESKRVLEKMSYCEWAALVVAVPKHDGIRLC